MRTSRSIVGHPRVTATWLLVVSVLVGPLGLGTHGAAAAVKSCGASCPCDAPGGDEHGCDHAGDATGHDAGHDAEHDTGHDAEHDTGHDAGLENRTPVDDECPDGCPDCNCCPGFVPGLVSFALPAAVRVTATTIPSPPGCAIDSVIVDVFRPPRSST